MESLGRTVPQRHRCEPTRTQIPCTVDKGLLRYHAATPWWMPTQENVLPGQPRDLAGVRARPPRRPLRTGSAMDFIPPIYTNTLRIQTHSRIPTNLTVYGIAERGSLWREQRSPLILCLQAVEHTKLAHVCHQIVTTMKKARIIRAEKSVEAVGGELVAGAGFEPATFRL